MPRAVPKILLVLTTLLVVVAIGAARCACSQDARVRIDIAAIDVRCRQATDTGTTNNEIVLLVRFLRRPALALHGGVSDLERTGVSTMHPGLGRRVIS